MPGGGGRAASHGVKGVGGCNLSLARGISRTGRCNARAPAGAAGARGAVKGLGWNGRGTDKSCIVNAGLAGWVQLTVRGWARRRICGRVIHFRDGFNCLLIALSVLLPTYQAPWCAELKPAPILEDADVNVSSKAQQSKRVRYLDRFRHSDVGLSGRAVPANLLGPFFGSVAHTGCVGHPL